MKKSIMKSALLMSLGLFAFGGGGASASESKRPNENPFGLVYQGALTENVTGKVNIRPVTYEVEGIEVAANLYLPADYDETSDKKYAAVTVAHPNGASKEQVAGLYAQRLAELGYIALACDARYQGASGGTPRLRDYPSNRIEDVSGMVDYLSQLPRMHGRRSSQGKLSMRDSSRRTPPMNSSAPRWRSFPKTRSIATASNTTASPTVIRTLRESTPPNPL